MVLKDGEIYISEELLKDPATIFEFPYITVGDTTYKQIRALPSGGVICEEV